jgi:hypothetical protein
MELRTLKARIVVLDRFSVFTCIQCFSGSVFLRADRRPAADLPDEREVGHYAESL